MSDALDTPEDCPDGINPSLEQEFRCIHELLVGQCADCRPPPAVDLFDEPSPQHGPWFCAGYGGYCSGCGEWFDEGDEICADGHGAWEARDCCGEAP